MKAKTKPKLNPVDGVLVIDNFRYYESLEIAPPRSGSCPCKVCDNGYIRVPVWDAGLYMYVECSDDVHTDTIYERIREFAAAKYINSWLKSSEMEIYVRKGRRLVGNNTAQIDAFEIGNINVRPDLRGKGYFTKLIEHLEKHSPYPLLFVENVHDERFADWFKSHGWSQYELSMSPPCFYKLRQVSK